MSLPRSATFVAAAFILGGCTLLLGYGDEAQLARDAATSPPNDADVPSPDAPAVDERPFCERQSPRPSFCASFDGPGYLAEWSETVMANARLDRDTSSFVSGPASLRISLDRKDDANVGASVSVPFNAWTDRAFSMAIAFDVQFEAVAPAGSFAVIASPIVMATTNRASYLVQLTGRALADGSTVALGLVEVTNSPDASRDHPSTASLQIGKWAHVELTMTLGGANNTARLTVDGTVGVEGPLELSGPGSPNVSFGLATVTSESTAWTYRFDNVTIDVR